MTTDRFTIQREGNGWRVVDVRTGHIHSARIHERWRAEAQARTMSDQHARLTTTWKGNR